MSISNLAINNVEIKNSIETRIDKINTISSCIGVDNDYLTRKWNPLCDTMNDVCFGVVNNKTVFVACSTESNTGDSKIYLLTNNSEVVLAHVVGYTFSKIFIYHGIIIAITTEGKIMKIDDINRRYNNDDITFIDFPEDVIDANMIADTLWILSATKLYQIKGAFDEIIPTADYPKGIAMESIVTAIGGTDVIIYTNSEELPMFIRYHINEKRFSAFTSAIPFKIVSAIIIGDNVSTLYTYDSDTKVRTLVLKDTIGFFDFNTHNGFQWVGKCTYYDGFIYNQYLDLSTGTPKLFLVRSINGITFRLISEDFDYCDEMYGKYCQGNGYSIFITPTLYKIKTPYIYGIDYSRYSDMLEVKGVQCSDKTDNILKFEITGVYCKMLDPVLTFVTLKLDGKNVVSAKIKDAIVDGDTITITIYTENPNILNSINLENITADITAKRIW